ncbi:MAG: RNA methyltransferase [Chloroflexota bacterium]
MITSRANPTIKQIRRLRERKERQQSGLFFVEGLRIVGEAIAAGWKVECLVFSPQMVNSIFGMQLAQDFQRSRGEVLEVSAEVFNSLSMKEGPQGIGAVVHQNWSPLDEIFPTKDKLWIALDSVADPGNLGTILRTNDAAGGGGVILLDQSTDPYDPAAIRASMGAIFRQQVVKTRLSDFARWKKTRFIGVVGTSDKAQNDFHYIHYPNPMVLLMGSERQGLQEHHLALCDVVAGIPMIGNSDSLNLAVAAALFIYEIFNQRRDDRRDYLQSNREEAKQ